MDKDIIIAEANFLESDIYDVYYGKIEFTVVLLRKIKLRLQRIRDEARKEDAEDSTHL